MTAGDATEQENVVGRVYAYAWLDEPSGRQVVHSRSGGIGADWDADDVAQFVRSADAIAWTNHWMGHDLAVRSGKRVVYFAVPRPPTTEGATDE